MLGWGLGLQCILLVVFWIDVFQRVNYHVVYYIYIKYIMHVQCIYSIIYHMYNHTMIHIFINYELYAGTWRPRTLAWSPVLATAVAMLPKPCSDPWRSVKTMSS